MPRPTVPLLSRTKIIQEAVALIDEVGVEGCTVRKIGGRLGVQSQSVYHYFTDRNALLAAVGLYVLQDVSYPEKRSSDWAHALLDDAIAYYRAVAAHPRVTTILLERTWRPGATIRFNTILRQMEAAGVSAVNGLAMIDAIEGIALSWLAFRGGPADRDGGGPGPDRDSALAVAQRELTYDEASFRQIVTVLIEGQQSRLNSARSGGEWSKE